MDHVIMDRILERQKKCEKSEEYVQIPPSSFYIPFPKMDQFLKATGNQNQLAEEGQVSGFEP